ncbi:MAG: Holliday junction branch migration DNA helicase RuvB [Mycoplasmataceae bacterium]|jgi:Holliday junction DNA helicase RuvB|nr:Holliday junction branch migration DNA helicase RuvB [Mycoplasmataceae bacterium]
MSSCIRPNNFNDFVGNEEVKENLRIFIEAAKNDNRQLDHCLIYGLPGTGKTTLAMIIANTLNAKIKILQGSNINKNVDLLNVLLSIDNGDVIFIDEIHSVKPEIMELLFSAMEDFAIDITIGKDFNTKVTRMKVPNFTLIGATTKFGKIPMPLEERFGIIINLKEYDIETLKLLVKQYAKKINLELNDDEIFKIASNSKNIPRNAIKILKRVYDFKTYDKNLNIDEILKKIKIIINGLTSDDFTYLETINKHDNPIGLKTISDIINVDTETIVNKIEPFLINNGYIAKCSNGRKITNLGIKMLNVYNKNNGKKTFNKVL